MSTFPPALSTLAGRHHRAPVVRPVPHLSLSGPRSRSSKRAILLMFGLPANYPYPSNPCIVLCITREDLRAAGGLL